MNPSPLWHPHDEMLQSYASGLAGPVLAASLEAHVLDCAECRTALVPAVEPLRLVRIRDGVEDRIDARGRPWSERFLRRLGLGEADARVLLAAPALRRAWWLAVALALGFGVAAAAQEPGRGSALLILAPLLPVLATAAAYAPRLEPALSLTAATPYPAMRLLLVRCVAVAGAATTLAVVAAVSLPGPAGAALPWLLPAAGLTASVLALSAWFDVEVAAGACCAGWLTAVWATAGRHAGDALAVFQAPGQVASALLLALAGAVLATQHHRLDPGSPA